MKTTRFKVIQWLPYVVVGDFATAEEAEACLFNLSSWAEIVTYIAEKAERPGAYPTYTAEDAAYDFAGY